MLILLVKNLVLSVRHLVEMLVKFLEQILVKFLHDFGIFVKKKYSTFSKNVRSFSNILNTFSTVVIHLVEFYVLIVK